MLKNALTLAIRGVDTAENEPTFEPMARAGSRADGFLRALTCTLRRVQQQLAQQLAAVAGFHCLHVFVFSCCSSGGFRVFSPGSFFFFLFERGIGYFLWLVSYSRVSPVKQS